MSKKLSNKWSLDPKDVSWGTHGLSSGKSGQFERKLKTTRSTVFLTHMPTGTRVEGEVPLGNYSKKEMQQQREQLKQMLSTRLEKLVAKKLGIKGR